MAPEVPRLLVAETESLRFILTSSFYPPYHIGGAELHVNYLAQELVKRGHEVHVLHSVDAYRVKRGKEQFEAKQDGVLVHPIETPLSASAYAAYVLGASHAVTRVFAALVEKVRPDVVHHHNVSLLGYNILARRGDYLNLYTAHDFWLICPRNTLLRRASQVCETASCMFCNLSYKRPPQLWRYSKAFVNATKDLDILIAPSNYTRERIARKLNLKAITIPNFVPSPPDSIQPSGFSGFFLFAGRLEAYKGVLQLIETFRQLDKRSSLRLIIVGTGSLEGVTQKMIERNHLSHRITQLGWMPQSLLYKFINDADALLVPSTLPENCPLVALEALSVGTPVIASCVGGLPEIVEKLDKRLLFQSSSQLVDILSHFKGGEDLSLRARRVYQEHYSADIFLKKYMTLIKERSATGP
jgi:glycosyltransferase involved in cell wall biosynthesis